MSIATLKKKTQTKYNNMSVGSTTGFSLNGTLRNQGYVGQTSLSRSLPKTMMKGNVKCGHGGCSGTYNNAPIIQSAVTSLNDPTVIKKSVLNTSGMIESKYMWTKRPFPYAVVKPDYNNNINDSGDYITKLSKATIKSVNLCDKILPTIQPKTQCANYDAYFKTNTCAYTKPESDYVAMSQGEYIINKNNKCIDNDPINPPKNTYRTPSACGNTV